jgi:hypothetical protein
MHHAMSGELVGRDEELQLVLSALEDLPAAVVLEGDAGIGKTSVWRAAVDALEARGVRVLSTRTAEAESRLSYAGLADVLDPVIDEALTGLPPPQRRALRLRYTAPSPKAVRRIKPRLRSPPWGRYVRRRGRGRSSSLSTTRSGSTRRPCSR